MLTSWIPAAHSPYARAWFFPTALATLRRVGTETPKILTPRMPNLAIPSAARGFACSCNCATISSRVVKPSPLSLAKTPNLPNTPYSYSATLSRKSCRPSFSVASTSSTVGRDTTCFRHPLEKLLERGKIRLYAAYGSPHRFPGKPVR